MQLLQRQLAKQSKITNKTWKKMEKQFPFESGSSSSRSSSAKLQLDLTSGFRCLVAFPIRTLWYIDFSTLQESVVS